MVINGEGWCYIFDFPVGAESDEILLKPAHVQRIVANTKVLLLHDVNSDGLGTKVEMKIIVMLVVNLYHAFFLCS